MYGTKLSPEYSFDSDSSNLKKYISNITDIYLVLTLYYRQIV
ncbi:hypothetical protein LEP1GSC196_1529 [Leptospira meyeri serovar Semaranga str. Veldrot Semarang 173]|nr:hypothetical protein LEP1GSC196_1529 [Leptospira meyeri serovar Semaranga str. Veldrot Semarang 173]